MRRINQRCESDCFPACIAMVAGISLRRAIELVHPNHVKGQDYSTEDWQGRAALEALGFRVSRKYKRVEDFSSLMRPAIVAIQLKCEKDGHVLVWDPESQKLLEPYKGYRSLPHSLYLESLLWIWELSR
jgi:ABC-type bacteriocin/lantibiotic exporter with double-glycine peptidase domain